MEENMGKFNTERAIDDVGLLLAGVAVLRDTLEPPSLGTDPLPSWIMYNAPGAVRPVGRELTAFLDASLREAVPEGGSLVPPGNGRVSIGSDEWDADYFVTGVRREPGGVPLLHVVREDGGRRSSAWHSPESVSGLMLDLLGGSDPAWLAIALTGRDMSGHPAKGTVEKVCADPVTGPAEYRGSRCGTMREPGYYSVGRPVPSDALLPDFWRRDIALPFEAAPFRGILEVGHPSPAPGPVYLDMGGSLRLYVGREGGSRQGMVSVRDGLGLLPPGDGPLKAREVIGALAGALLSPRNVEAIAPSYSAVGGLVARHPGQVVQDACRRARQARALRSMEGAASRSAGRSRGGRDI